MSETPMKGTPMADDAQVGDTVRITMMTVVEAVVYKDALGNLMASAFRLDSPNVTVEILSRAIPPMPSEPGTFWLDVGGFVWIVTSTGVLFRPGSHTADPKTYAPFRQLVLK